MEVAPLPHTKPSEKLTDNDFALFVNGNRARAEVKISEQGHEIVVTFRTTLAALADPRVDPVIDAAWGGWKPGDTAHVRQPSKKKLPSNGFVEIESIRPAQKAGEPTYFVCRAMTAVYDWEDDGKMICDATQRLMVPADWFVR